MKNSSPTTFNNKLIIRQSVVAFSLEAQRRGTRTSTPPCCSALHCTALIPITSITEHAYDACAISDRGLPPGSADERQASSRYSDHHTSTS